MSIKVIQFSYLIIKKITSRNLKFRQLQGGTPTLDPAVTEPPVSVSQTVRPPTPTEVGYRHVSGEGRIVLPCADQGLNPHISKTTQ